MQRQTAAGRDPLHLGQLPDLFDDPDAGRRILSGNRTESQPVERVSRVAVEHETMLPADRDQQRNQQSGGRKLQEQQRQLPYPPALPGTTESGSYRNPGEKNSRHESRDQKYGSADAQQDDGPFRQQQGLGRNAQQVLDQAAAQKDQHDRQNHRDDHVQQRLGHRQSQHVASRSAVRLVQGDLLGPAGERRERDQDIVHHRGEQQSGSQNRQHHEHVPDVARAGVHLSQRFHRK